MTIRELIQRFSHYDLEDEVYLSCEILPESPEVAVNVHRSTDIKVVHDNSGRPLLTIVSQL